MKLKKSIAFSENGFVFNAERGDSFSVNDTGMKIIQMMQDQHSIEDISKHLLESFDIDEDTVEKDLYDFFKTLSNHHLMEEV